MRKLLPAFALVALLFTPRVSSAGPVAVGDLLQFTGSLGTLGGGAFLVDNTSDGVQGVDFMTFCIQMTQYLDYSHLFRVGNISNSADDPGGPDPLDAKTKWIFGQFDAGELGGYSSDEIQTAIWKIEGESTDSFGNSDQLIADAAAGIAAGWYDPGVRVLNLFYYPDGTPAQDQLSFVAVAPLLPPSGTPEPATLALMGLGGAVLAARKRFAKSNGADGVAIG